MHQPDYRDPSGPGDMVLPWVRLHGVRAYTDLAWLLERHPEVRCTVNITQCLADQLDELARERIDDRALYLSRRGAEELTLHDRVEILRSFFMVDWEKAVRPIPRYWQLLHKRGRDLRTVDLTRVAPLFTDQELRDLQVLFNLVWTGFAAREDEELVKNLLRKGQDFTEVEKDCLLDLHLRLCGEVLPRWQRLAERGQVELTTSPYYHPILPLLLDTDSAREALPEIGLPPRVQREQDAREQIERALEAHGRRFGACPRGMWPAEGSVSDRAVRLLAEYGLAWAASDEEVLRRSDLDGPLGSHDLYQPWRYEADGRSIDLLFRDRHLSDLIGFTYAGNPGPDAALDLCARLADVSRSAPPGDRPLLVPIILDGENPWEHYPDSGRGFLEHLFRTLERGEHEGVPIQAVTFSEHLDRHPPVRQVRRVHAGSWIEGSFRVWIGHEEENTAWRVIGDAGHVLDVCGPSLAAQNREEALGHLLAAQGSDWMWWFGDDFLTETPETFDGLFRARLQKVYELTGEATPQRLRHAISASARGAQFTMPLREPWSLVTPVIDGEATPPTDWSGAGLYRPGRALGNMFRGTTYVDALYYGLDMTELFLRLELSEEAALQRDLGFLEVQIVASDRVVEVHFPLRKGNGPGHALRGCDTDELGRYCFGDLVEVALPFETMGLPPGAKILLLLRLLSEGVEIERLPRYGHLTVTVPSDAGAGPSTRA